ncbi:SCO-spondin-like [Haliotis asinina]|uniref:SCO-spondin-like n=1 Tax=Haliotis asinina TaxID=109174 RepID=UPI003531CDC7
MSAVTLLSVFVFLLITSVQETRAQSGQICVRLMVNNVNEDVGSVMFEIFRKQGTAGSVAVDYTITDVTTEPEDIIGPRTGTVMLNDGETLATISVEINDDTIEEDTEQFTLSLTGQTGPESQATALIFDNDVYSPWGAWMEGIECSVTCGPGNITETRTRTCVAVIPIRCVQPSTETRIVACNPGPCPGKPPTEIRSVACNPGPCPGKPPTETQSVACNPGPCPGKPPTESRSVACNPGPCPGKPPTESRSVACNPGPCPGKPPTETRSVACNPGPCPGKPPTKIRSVACNPGPCPGKPPTEIRSVACNPGPCPVITEWSEWTDEGTCSTTCGPGSQMQSRTRNCTGLCPTDFVSNETRTVACELCSCPVISQWTEWTDEGPCSTTCGPGTQMQARNRTCTNSTCCPDDLTLNETRTVMCELCTCPVISQWTEWTNVGPCSTTCGPGTQVQVRNRTCTNSTCCPDDLTLNETRTVMCELCTCPVIGPWCPWVIVGPCSVTCGCGTQKQARSRVCVNTCIPPDCVKREERTVNCSHKPSPTSWTSWNSWSGTGWPSWYRRTVPDGEDGTEVQDGEDGTEVQDGEDGTEVQGGKDGTEVQDGSDGTEVQDGADGTVGQDGADGTEVQDGADGTDGDAKVARRTNPEVAALTRM